MTGIYYLDYFTDYDAKIGGGEGSAFIHYDNLRNIIVNGLKNERTSSAYEKYRRCADQFNKTAERFALELIND